MATTLDIVNPTPSSVLFRFSATDQTPVYLKRDGAANPDKDLTALLPGPLRSFLYRLPLWAWQPYPNLAGVRGRTLRWSRAYLAGEYYQTPVVASVIDAGPAVEGSSFDVKIDQAGPDGQWFSFTAGSAVASTFALIELRFIRSQNR
jgi:hypothetical protein